MEHEAVVNQALKNRDVTALCLYDATQLDDDVLADACSAHPLLWKCGSTYPSTDYAGRGAGALQRAAVAQSRRGDVHGAQER